MENTSDDYFFSLELVTTVMRKYHPNWQTDNPQDHGRIHFNCGMEDAILTILDKKDIELFLLFCDEFSFRGITADSFAEICGQLRTDFTCDAFDEKEFFWYCVVISAYAVMADARNVDSAPYVAIRMIFQVLKHYRDREEFTDDSYSDVEQAALGIADETLDLVGQSQFQTLVFDYR